MKKISPFLAFALSVLMIGCNTNQKKNTLENNLVDFLKSNWQTPEDYVIKKFENHDYVFIGEYHRIKHDVDLILRLIPFLHEHGINNLAIEFGNYKDQYIVDSLLNLPVFDRNLAKQIMFNGDPFWGYVEYIDIYRVAWDVNHNKNQDEKKIFRIINIGPYYDPCKEGGAWRDIDPDRFMADVVFKEIINKKEKGLIYSGNHHAFTKYRQPIFDFDKDTLYRLANNRMGNVIYDSVGNRAFNIYLHAAWISDKGWDKNSVLPVNGVIDSIMKIFDNKPVGFDVINTPFGKLTCNNSYYTFGYPGFTLDKYCDGYIFQNAFADYKPITMEDNYITKENLHIARKKLICIGFNKEEADSLTVENANVFLFEDIRNHFKHLMNK